MDIFMEIGGYRVSLKEPMDRQCFIWPNKRFEPFLTPRSGYSDITITVRITKTLPTLNKGELIFDSGVGLWKLYDNASDGFLIESCLPGSGRLLSQSKVSRDFSSIQATLREVRPKNSTRTGWTPNNFLNPILETVLQLKLAREGGVILHSSAVLTGEEALLFCGPSGAGKSTIADFFLDRGYTVLNDERVIIRKTNDNFTAFGTPWTGSSDLFCNRHGKLKNLFLLRQGQTSHEINQVSQPQMIAALMQQTYLPYWDAVGMSRIADFFQEITETRGCLGLSFVKSPDVVDFLNEKFLAHTR